MTNQLTSNVAHLIRKAANECIPINDLFTSALQDPFNLLVGGVGGFVIKFGIVLVLVVLLVRALVNIIRSRRAGEDISSIAIVIVAVVAVILGIIIVRTVFTALNGSCGAF